MDVKHLYYLGRKVIQKKYPWIDDLIFYHRYDNEDTIEYWSLEIWPKPGFREKEVFLDKYEAEIENEMKSLFSMLGPKSYEQFDKVTIW